MTFVRSLLFVCLFFVAAPQAMAQQAVPGDACSPNGLMTQSTGPELSGAGHFMLCVAGTWKSILSFDNTGKVGFGDTTPDDPFHFVGTQIRIDNDTNTANKGCLRYDGTGNKLQFSHDCTTFADMGGGAGNIQSPITLIATLAASCTVIGQMTTNASGDLMVCDDTPSVLAGADCTTVGPGALTLSTTGDLYACMN